MVQARQPARRKIVLDGNRLTVDDLVRLARPARHGYPHAVLGARARQRLRRVRRQLDRAIAAGAHLYGVTTGFGALQSQTIGPADRDALQLNLVRSHAAGIGPWLSEETVRAMVAVRANSLAMGYSGVRPELVELLVELLNRRVYPAIPARGSVGASGDLAPLAHLALTLLGEGQAWLRGRLVSSREALQAAGLQPLGRLAPKEGVALVNGTALMAGQLALALVDAEALADVADIATALSLEAVRGHRDAFEAAAQQLRPHPGQVEAAARLRWLLHGSQLTSGLKEDGWTLSESPPAPPPSAADSGIAGPGGVQDPYSFRCAPQVHGAARDGLSFVRRVLEVELNAATDNPLLVPQDDHLLPISQGNFHGQPLSQAADLLAIAVASLGAMAERRCAKLLGGHAGLPPFLAAQPGLNSGLMLAQYSAAALVAENRVLAHPASVDSIPTSDGYEDHVSMGVTATAKAERVVANVRTILAIELLCAAQALDFQRHASPGLAPAPATARAHASVRTVVPFLATDQPLQPLIAALDDLIASGRLAEQVGRGVRT